MDQLQRIKYMQAIRTMRPKLRPIHELHTMKGDYLREMGRIRVAAKLEQIKQENAILHCPNCNKQYSYCKDCKTVEERESSDK